MKLSRLKNIVLLAALSLSTVSCLDKYPEDSIPEGDAVNTAKDVDQLVIGLYASFKSSYLYSGQLTLLPDIQADLVYAVDGYTNIYGDVWRWNILTDNSDIEGVYGSLNEVVGNANFILEGIAKIEKTVSDADYDKLQSYKGEALFARALANAELIKLFCPSYKAAEADKQLGIVISKSYSQSPELKRASLKDSYAFVLDDLNKARELLKIDEDDNSTVYNLPYFSEYTADALLARTYLYMGDWANAVKYSSEVINSGKFALASVSQMYNSSTSYFRYMWQYGDSPETIWKVGFTTTSYGGALGSAFFNAVPPSNYKPDYVPAQWALNLYSSEDLRYSTYFQSVQTSYDSHFTWPLLAKYYGNQDFLNINIYGVCRPHVFRLAEQYLIRAEAYCRMGNYSNASKDLTTLAAARYGTQNSSGSVTASNVQMSVNESNWFQTINDERVRELFMEGFRLQDLKRWCADGLIKGNAFSRTPQEQSLPMGSSLTIKANDYRMVWPIPKHEIDLPGSHIQQNEGYTK